MKGRFKLKEFKNQNLVNEWPWKDNKIHTDFPLILAQIFYDFMGSASKLSTLASYGFYMAVGPGGVERENPSELFKKQIEAMERLASSPQPEKNRIQLDTFQGKKEILYNADGKKYYAIQVDIRDLQLRNREIVIEAALAEKNPKTSGLKIGEFGIFTKYPASSENIYLLNYGQHSEIRKDDDLTLSRRIEFIF